MADNLTVSSGSGNSVAMDEVSDAVLGTVKVQYVKIMDGTDNGTSKAAVDSSGLRISFGGIAQPVTATLAASSLDIGKVGHNISGIADGRKIVTTAGTRVTLASSTACKRVTIVAETDNTGLIVVGGSTVVATLATRQGVPLNAGDSYEAEIDDLADIYIDSTVSGDGVTFTYST